MHNRVSRGWTRMKHGSDRRASSEPTPVLSPESISVVCLIRVSSVSIRGERTPTYALVVQAVRRRGVGPHVPAGGVAVPQPLVDDPGDGPAGPDDGRDG